MNQAAPIDKGYKLAAHNKPFGQIERDIARRYLFASKKQGGVSTIAWISFACISLAIVALIFIMSVMNGFRATVLELTLGTSGHMFVHVPSANPSKDAVEQLERRLASIDGVDQAFQFTENLTGVQANNRISLGHVIGITPLNLGRYEAVSGQITSGSLEEFGQGRGANNQVAVGYYLAQQLGLQVGDIIVVFSGRTRSTVAGSAPITKGYTVGAIFKTGLYTVDQTTIFMGYEQGVLFFEGGKNPGNIQIKLKDPDQINSYYTPIREAAEQPIFIEDWRDRDRNTASALRTEQIAMRAIFIVVVIISTFPILAAMTMLVKNKARDIAILRTIGATRHNVMRIFFMTGASIGVAGTIFGLIMGIILASNVGVIQAMIEFVTGRPLFPPDVYLIDGGIPAKIIWSEVVSVALSGFLISAIATFFPALNASRIDPVEALRYE